jgi:hypothetical protein
MSSPLPNRPTEPSVLIPKQQLLKGSHSDHLSHPLEEFQTYKQSSCLTWKHTWKGPVPDGGEGKDNAERLGSAVAPSLAAIQTRLADNVPMV